MPRGITRGDVEILPTFAGSDVGEEAETAAYCGKRLALAVVATSDRNIREIRLWFTPCARKTDKLVSSVVAPGSQIRGLASESLEQTPNASHRPRMKHTYSKSD